MDPIIIRLYMKSNFLIECPLCLDVINLKGQIGRNEAWLNGTQIYSENCCFGCSSAKSIAHLPVPVPTFQDTMDLLRIGAT